MRPATVYRSGAPNRRCLDAGVPHTSAAVVLRSSGESSDVSLRRAAFSSRSAEFSWRKRWISDRMLRSEAPDASSIAATALAEEGSSLLSLTCVSTSLSAPPSRLSGLSLRSGVFGRATDAVPLEGVITVDAGVEASCVAEGVEGRRATDAAPLVGVIVVDAGMDVSTVECEGPAATPDHGLWAEAPAAPVLAHAGAPGRADLVFFSSRYSRCVRKQRRRAGVGAPA